MIMDFEIGSVSLSSHSGDLRNAEATQATSVVRMTLYPQERHHLDLETGETLSHPRYESRYKTDDGAVRPAIEAHCSFIAAKEPADFNRSTFNYFGGSTKNTESENLYDSGILMNVFLADVVFNELLGNFRAGLIPKRLSAHLRWSLDDKVLTYGWEPDGSGKKWANKDEANRSIPIEKVFFDYDLRLVEVDDKTKDPVIISSHTLDDTLLKTLIGLVARVAKIEATTKSILELIKVVVMAVVVALAVWFFKYR